jgi:hypothetical protein
MSNFSAVSGEQKRTAHDRPQHIGREVLVELSMINSDGALAGAEENAGGGRFATTRCVVFDACNYATSIFLGC